MKHRYMKNNRGHEPQKPAVRSQGVPNIPLTTQDPATRADSGQNRGSITQDQKQEEPKITLFDIMVEAIQDVISGNVSHDAIVEGIGEFLQENKVQVLKHPTTVRSAGTQLSGEISSACRKVEELYQRAVDRVLAEA